MGLAKPYYINLLHVAAARAEAQPAAAWKTQAEQLPADGPGHADGDAMVLRAAGWRPAWKLCRRRIREPMPSGPWRSSTRCCPAVLARTLLPGDNKLVARRRLSEAGGAILAALLRLWNDSAGGAGRGQSARTCACGRSHRPAGLVRRSAGAAARRHGNGRRAQRAAALSKRDEAWAEQDRASACAWRAEARATNMRAQLDSAQGNLRVALEANTGVAAAWHERDAALRQCVATILAALSIADV